MPKIIVGCDGTDGSEAAVAVATELAKDCGDSLVAALGDARPVLVACA